MHLSLFPEAGNVRRHMRTCWSISASCRVGVGGHLDYKVGEEFCVQVLVPKHDLLEALPQLQVFLSQQNLELLDILACCRFDLDDPEQEISDYVRRDMALIETTGEPTISVYVVVAKESEH